MTEATSSGFYERQRALRQHLAVLEAAVVLDGMHGWKRTEAVLARLVQAEPGARTP
jgi:hypothetical protein